MRGVSRRTFLKVFAASGAAMTAGGGLTTLAHAQTAPQPAEQRIRGGCRACGKMECGIWIVLRNGRPFKIEGDHSCLTSEGNSCSKSQASIQAMYHPDRILYPMKRTRPKGQNPGWVRISWDEALDTAVREYKKVIDKYGPHSVINLHGTSRIYTYGGGPLLGALGSANVGGTAGQVCKGPRFAASAMTCFAGANWAAIVDGVEVLVQWGTATETSNYDDSAVVTVDRRYKAKSHIVVGPTQQNFGAQADMWLPLRPGTDGALALGWMNVIINNKMYDEAFLKQWSNAPLLYSEDITPSGFEWVYTNLDGEYPLNIKTRLVKESDLVKNGSPKKFAYYDTKTKKVGYLDSETGMWDRDFKEIDPAMTGTYSLTSADGRKINARPVWDKFTRIIGEWTPNKTGEVCRLDPKLIEEAAKTYGQYKHGGGIQHALSLEHNGNAIQTCRNVLLIMAITGNIDNKGGQRGGEPTDHVIGLLIPPYALTGMPPATPEKRNKIAGADRFPLMPWITTLGSAAGSHDSTSAMDMILTGKPYPIRAQLSVTGSHFHAGNALKNWNAMKSLDFYFGSELWFSPTIELADIVVPTTHWIETKTARPSQGAHAGLGYNPGFKPRGEARSDNEMCITLAKRFGIPWISKEEADMFSGGNQWPTVDQLMDRCFLPIGMTDKEFNEKFQKEGWMSVKQLRPDTMGRYQRYESGHLRIDGKIGFPTPTTRVELISTILESYHGDTEAWPVYHEPPLSPYTERGRALSKEYPLTLTCSQRVPVYFHSEHRQIPYLRELYPVPRLRINPATAAGLKINDGDWVFIESHKGKITMCAELFEGMAEDVVSGDHQWWYPELPAPEHGCHISNMNVLVDEYSQDPIGGATNLRGYPVKVYKAPGAPEGIIASANDPRLRRWMPREV